MKDDDIKKLIDSAVEACTLRFTQTLVERLTRVEERVSALAACKQRRSELFWKAAALTIALPSCLYAAARLFG